MKRDGDCPPPDERSDHTTNTPQHSQSATGVADRICVPAHPDTALAVHQMAEHNRVSEAETIRVALGVLRSVETVVRSGDLLAVVERDERGRLGAVRELTMPHLKPIRKMSSSQRADELLRDPDGYYKRCRIENYTAAMADIRARDQRRAREKRRRWLRWISLGFLGEQR